MPSITRTVLASAMLALANGQAVITAAKGESGTSLGLQVDAANQADANFISQAEITGNIVNGCGRTLLGNIDIGEQTENALAAKAVTTVKKGSTVSVTLSQRNANGTGPFSCDMDQTSNAGENRVLQVTQGTATSATGDVTIKVAMPDDLACVGASTGNICTVRCVNAAEFGGCFAVQQTDITAKENTPDNIPTAQTLEGVLAQVQQNQKDLPGAFSGIGSATDPTTQNEKVLEAILAADPGIETLSVTPVAAAASAALASSTTAAAAAATTTAASKKGNGKGNGKGNANAKGNGNANAATAKGNKNNQRSESSALRWAKRYVVAGTDYTPDGGN